MTAEPASVERGVVVWSHARDLLRVFRPQAWVVLQDLVLDAEWRDGRLVASSSARLVAEHLRIDPDTAAAALRALRDRGVAELTQSSGQVDVSVSPRTRCCSRRVSKCCRRA